VEVVVISFHPARRGPPERQRHYLVVIVEQDAGGQGVDDNVVPDDVIYM
jgi:hypothetical protein